MANGDLLLATNAGNIIEKAPYAYQKIGNREVPVPCRYQLTGQDVSFHFPQGYQAEYPLTIDPELVFATFSGAGNFGGGYFSFCTTYDHSGNLYTAGNPVRVMWGPPPLWPTTPGAFQPNWSSIYEPMVCINKYSANGSQLLYSTYYGGAGPNDLPHSMIVNSQGELILAGSTGSFNLPVTRGCFDNTKSGGTDIFVAHFNNNGSGLIGATYVGGNIGNSINGIDIFSTFGLNAAHQNKTSPVELMLDSMDNIWVVSNTSTIDFPVTSNALQTTYGGGNSDAVVFALNSSCTQMLYGTYLGGSHTDAAYSIQINRQGSVLVCGGTRSNNFPVSGNAILPGVPSQNNEWNGFVCMINPQSGNLVHSTYLGTVADDQAVGLQLNSNDEVYILGRTFGDYSISPGVFKMDNTDVFIHKLSSNLTVDMLSTRLGNPINGGTAFFPTGFLVDNCENVYLTGLSSDNEVPLQGMPLTPNANQTTPGNFWFGVLRPNFSSLLFGTYFGRVHDPAQGINGDHTHVGTNRLDPRGILYQSLCVNSPDYPGTTTQSWSQYNQNNVGQDIVSFKFAFNLAGVVSSFDLEQGYNDSACAPYTVTFHNTATMAMDYTWDFGDGSPVSHDVHPTHTYTQEGVYTVTLYAHNDTSCITDDTSYLELTIFDPQVPDITISDTLVCNTMSMMQLAVTVNNPSLQNSFRWSPSIGILGQDNQQTVTVNPALNDKYYITVWDTVPGFCGFSVKDSVRIDYKPRSLELRNNDTLICQGASVQIDADGTVGYFYQWTPTAGVDNQTVLNALITPPLSEQYTVVASYPGCNDTIRTIHIEVDEPTAVQFYAVPDSICTGESIKFYPVSDAVQTLGYTWNYADLYSHSQFTLDPMQSAFDQPGVIPVTLTASYRACPDSAFTDTVFVQGFPKVYLGPDTGLCLHGAPIILQNQQPSNSVATRYLWNTGDTSHLLKVVHPGIYSLRVIESPLGCSTTENIEVHKDCYIDVPNVFTPNADGVNDYFFPRQLLSKKVTAFKMQVLNRWGQIVFVTERLDGSGWDGKLNGIDQPQGVYVYLIEAILDENRVEKYQGNVTLLR